MSKIKEALSTPAKIAQGVIIVIALGLLAYGVVKSGDSAIKVLYFALFGAVAGAVAGYQGRVNWGNVGIAAAALAAIGALFQAAV